MLKVDCRRLTAKNKAAYRLLAGLRIIISYIFPSTFQQQILLFLL